MVVRSAKKANYDDKVAFVVEYDFVGMVDEVEVYYARAASGGTFSVDLGVR